MDHLRSGVGDQPDQHGETLSLLKNTKISQACGGCLQSQVLRRLRQENRLNSGGGGCGEPRWCHWTPAGAIRVRLSQKRKENVLASWTTVDGILFTKYELS